MLTASLPSYSGTNPDTADTLAVDLTESGGTLATATASRRRSSPTRCASSTPSSCPTRPRRSPRRNHYSLTTLYRGLYGTAIASHSSRRAVRPARQHAIFKYDLPAQYVGQTLYIKFQSFNVFGGGVQDLSTCTAYTYTPTGDAIDHPVAEAIEVNGGSWDFGLVTGTVNVEDDLGTSLTLSVETDLDLGPA